jgi:uncharacterized protein (TIGR03118 family)
MEVSMKSHRRACGALAVSLLTASAALAQAGAQREPVQLAGTAKDNSYRVSILVSNEAGEAPVVDPLLRNAWGIAAGGATGPWWVANEATGTSTLYTGEGAKLPLEVGVPGAPTGTVFNGGSSFQLAAGAPARFLFASLDGTISAWNTGTVATVIFTDPGSVYIGLAIHGDRLYSNDFASCEVEAFEGNPFDGTFDEIDTEGGFEDHNLPAGYCPFGIQAIGDSIFVTYAKKEGDEEETGIGLGFVREFDTDGNLIARVGSHGLLNAPWGVAMAPENFGRFSSCLLVGNFGDGKIIPFCKNEAGQWHQSGRLREGAHALSIDGLWGIGFGNGGVAGPTNILYFAAGPDDEVNGYYGKIEFEPEN